MATQHLQFKDVPVGHDFTCNGNWYTKRSTRTALLHSADRIFYFGMKEQVEMPVPVPTPTPAEATAVNSGPAPSYSTQFQLETPLNDEESDPVIRSALRILAGRLADPSEKLQNPVAAVNYLRLQLAGFDREVFGCLWLTNQHHALKFEELSRGTIDSTSVYPREVVKAALKANAAAVIFCHNHPSGDVEPSQSDLTITRRLKAALELVEVRVLDHVIIGGSKNLDYLSMATRGLI